MRGAARQQPSIESVHLPAPLGGINTVDAGSAMPARDCIYLYNLIAAEYGLRSRLGYELWQAGSTGSLSDAVRSLLPFKGSRDSGADDRLFAVTDAGIWDVSAGTGAPSQVVTFPFSTEHSGWGVSHAFLTAAGRFLVYCDSEHGAYLYSETSATWAQLVVGTRQPWQGSTAYAVGNRVVNSGNVYECDVAGTSAASGGPTGTGADITDGTARWDFVSAVDTTAIGPSLADQNLGYTADPGNFVHVTAWKNRLFFTERNTAIGYFLDVNSIYGVATSVNFGAKMRSGGSLVGLWNWSYDGGSGLDTLLVGVSTGGDVVIYQGTDPSSILTFGLKGCWYVGAVPSGRRIATEHGGDLLIMSVLGVVQLSKLVVGAAIEDRSIYATAKISNLFNQLASTRAGLKGWSIHIHPTDNALLVAHPAVTEGNTEQLAMAFATRGWSRYRDLPLICGAVWNGEFYFGALDGTVYRNRGYVDNVVRGVAFWIEGTVYAPGDQVVNGDKIYECIIGGTSAVTSGGVPPTGPTGTGSGIVDGTVTWDYVRQFYSPVQWSVFGAYQNLGTARQKQVQMIRPSLLSGDSSPVVQATAKYNYDLLEPSAPSGSSTGAGWDYGLWNTAVWGGDYGAGQPMRGAAGMGRDVAIAIRGTATSRTVLVGYDVLFTQGGLL